MATQQNFFKPPELGYSDVPDLIDEVLTRKEAYLVISTSSGKDSYAMLNYLKKLYDSRGWRATTIAVHSDLGRAEWAGTSLICRAQCQDVDIPLYIVSRRQGDLVTRIWQRWLSVKGTGKPPFPSSSSRFCTSDLKASVIDKFMRSLPSTLLVNAMGLRAGESSSRAKKPVLAIRKSITSKRWKEAALEDAWAQWSVVGRQRLVLDWLPIHSLSFEQVWELGGTSTADVERRRALFAAGKVEEALTGFCNHYAYVIGNNRLSCSCCIFAPAEELTRGASYNRELHQEYVAIERESGFTFKADLALADLLVYEPLIPAQKLAAISLRVRRTN